MFQQFAQTTTNAADAQLSAGSVASLSLIYLVLIILIATGIWRMFEKAGKPGWAALVPLYREWNMVQMTGKSLWWFFLLFVPLVNFVIIVRLYIEVARAFGKRGSYALMMVFFPFVAFPTLGFGAARYKDPNAPEPQISYKPD